MVQGAPDNKQMPLSDTSGTAVRHLLRAERGHTVSGRGFLGNGRVLLQNINKKNCTNKIKSMAQTK